MGNGQFPPGMPPMAVMATAPQRQMSTPQVAPRSEIIGALMAAAASAAEVKAKLLHVASQLTSVRSVAEATVKFVQSSDARVLVDGVHITPTQLAEKMGLCGVTEVQGVGKALELMQVASAAIPLAELEALTKPEG